MFKNQPKGLIPAALSNMGERFGYYIMNAVLVLFLCSKFGLSEETSALIYSFFYAGIYVLSLVGGLIADNKEHQCNDSHHKRLREPRFLLLFHAANVGRERIRTKNPHLKRRRFFSFLFKLNLFLWVKINFKAAKINFNLPHRPSCRTSSPFSAQERLPR